MANIPNRENEIGTPYQFRDLKEAIANSKSNFFVNNSLCANCCDYYEKPPCLTNFLDGYSLTSLDRDFSCFPSLLATDHN